MIRCGSLKTVYRFETSLTATVLTSLYVIISAVLYCQGIVIALTIVFTSGITKVGVTRGGNWGCHPHFFLKKWQPFLVITVCLSVLQCHPIIFSWEMMTFFAHHCHLYCFHIDFTRVSPPPLRALSTRTFLPLWPPLSTILCKFTHNFFLRVSPPRGCHRGRSAPRPLSHATGLSCTCTVNIAGFCLHSIWKANHLCCVAGVWRAESISCRS